MRGTFAISAAIHGAILALVALGLPAPAPEGAAEATGLGGLEVSLGPVGSAPGGEAVPVTEVAEAETVDATEVVEAVPEPAVQVTEVLPEAAPDEVEPAPTPEPPAEEVVAEPVEPVEAVEETPDMVEVVAQDVIQPPLPPKMKPPVPPRETARETPPDPAPQERAETVSPSEAVPEQTAAVPPGAGGKSGTEDQPEAGSGDTSAGGGTPGAADYLAVLRAWLERHKEYPRRAMIRRQEGTVLLHFVMDRGGRVLSYRVEQSSGHSMLDREVEEMIERAQPLPAIPEEMQQARLELTVPIQFFLK